MPQNALTTDGWRLTSPTTLNLLEKLRNAGKPLGEYVKGRFYRGITTGLNEAFVVDRAMRNLLIAEHQSSAEVLKPFLRGRDVKRWQTENMGFYLCYVGWGLPIEDYPAIYAHLKRFGGKLKRRPEVKQGRVPWYALSRYASDYWQEFEQPKVICGRFMNKATFAFDTESFFHNDALYMIAGVYDYVVAILNSSISWWFLCQICTDLQNGYLQAFRENLSQIPVSFANAKQQSTIFKLVDRILASKRTDPRRGCI